MSATQVGAAGFLSKFETLQGQLPGDANLRSNAAAAFRKTGLPGGTPQRRPEAWKYTSLRPLAETLFEAAAAPRQTAESLLAELMLLQKPRLVFVDGKFSASLSQQSCVGFSRFADQAEMGTLTWPDRDPMVALNTMLAADGATLHVPAGADGGIMQLVSLTTRDTDSHPRHYIRLEAGASLTLFEASVGQGSYLLNTVAEVHVAEGARLTHIRLQNESATAFHVSTAYIEIGKNGVYDSFTLNLGSRLCRTEVHAELAGAAAIAHVNAVQLLDRNQHADFTTVVRHAAPACTSRQTVKNVLSGQSRGVFQGRIEVTREAQKTDGYQMNQALLLSSEAEIDIKPELEIFADDVKCSHGAAVGELDAEQMFYLRSRGIPEPQARSILVGAFLDEALQTVQDETIRVRLEEIVETWRVRHAA